jgi:hypothetical protein
MFNTRVKPILILGLAFLPSFATADSFVMQCFEPRGVRIEALENNFEKSPDGYSNSNPTFVFLAENPAVLIETWAVANPYSEILNRSEIDAIIPPNASQSVVVKNDGDVLHARSNVKGSEAYSTTLYLKEGKAVFTRVQTTLADSFTHQPMGALYVADCGIQWLQ